MHPSVLEFPEGTLHCTHNWNSLPKSHSLLLHLVCPSAGLIPPACPSPQLWRRSLSSPAQTQPPTSNVACTSTVDRQDCTCEVMTCHSSLVVVSVSSSCLSTLCPTRRESARPCSELSCKQDWQNETAVTFQVLSSDTVVEMNIRYYVYIVIILWWYCDHHLWHSRRHMYMCNYIHTICKHYFRIVICILLYCHVLIIIWNTVTIYHQL